MKILFLSISNHDSSFSIIEDGIITNHFLAERFSEIKRDYSILPIFQEFIKNDKEIYDLLAVEIFTKTNSNSKHQLENLILFLASYDLKFKKRTISFNKHHIYHSYSGFYTSPFEDSLCFVLDGNGSYFYNKNKKNNISMFAETESIFLFEKNRFKKTLYKKYVNFDQDKKLMNDSLSIGIKYSSLAKKMGFSLHDAGKVMGLGQYKNYEYKLPSEYSGTLWKRNVKESYELQKYAQHKISNLIEKYSTETGIKNIILTGGVALNCVANYHLIKKFPNLNFHIDPLCSDKGISIGGCLYNYIKITQKIPKKINNSYLGHIEDNMYIKEKIQSKNYDSQKVDYSDVAKLINDGNIVALFQGKSESGERSLGNRSLLFDPRVKNGKTIVNKIKRRENFRPFAATVLLEYADDWFDLGTLKESPTMSFAVNAHLKTIELIPSVIHADNTCRIQTITEDQNYHFYKLIKTFYDLTSIPMILNTSFNLAEKPIVENFEQSIFVLKNSLIKYLYLPEIETLIKIKNLYTDEI